MHIVKYKAISNKQPFKKDWRTVKEFFDDVKLTTFNKGKWFIENGTVFMERSYKDSQEWENAITIFHQNVKRVRNYRFEIVKEDNGEANGI